jgi:cellulose synthase (UDP-forming)
VLLLLVSAWAGSSVFAWAWWFSPEHVSSVLTLVASSLLLAIGALLLPIWFYFWLWRIRAPDPLLEVPPLRTAMIVTKAPSEPWPLVRKTLEAMLGQTYPSRFDVWLADEQPDAETLAWCERNGVLVSCREGVADYHRATWPRRTHCKEGNLAYFYDMWGYDHYEVVTQLDADHIPAEDYLQRMVVPFGDPEVGYVAAPSICDRNAASSWSARGRLYAEAVLHGPTQAGHNGGYAPSCIGSHYAVRTAALKQIGGLGPELAEDFTTTLMMSAHGWQGVFAIDAEARGDGPETIGDCMRQEFQWSRSMMKVLLTINGRYWGGLSTRAKVRLGFCELWYPVFAVLMLASVVLPVIAILTRTPLMQLSLGDFYLHFLPPTLVLLATVVWLRHLGLTRPRDARAISWELPLFQLVRWPWVLFGCLQSLAGWVARREFDFKVTPKGSTGPAPLSGRILAPYLLLALVSALPRTFGVNAGAAHGYYLLTTINVVLYAGAAVLIAALHVIDHPPKLRIAVVRQAGAKFAAIAGATAVVVPSALLPLGFRGPLPYPAPWPIGHGQNGSLALGVTTDQLARNSAFPWTAPELGQVNEFERQARAHVSIVMWFADWRHAPFERSQLEAVARRGSTPEITWEPWDSTIPRGRPQPAFTLASIIAGRYDAYIGRWARSLRAYGKPVLLRFAHEMNANWYPWSEPTNGNRPGQFAAAWRHVHDIFGAAGAHNVKWIWSPSATFSWSVKPEYYPGNRYVDIVALTGFNGGTSLSWGGWRSFAHIFNRYLVTLERVAPHKPIQISEVSTATAGGDRATWVRQMVEDLRYFPAVRSVVWFDVRKETDWRVDASAGTLAGLASVSHVWRWATRGT